MEYSADLVWACATAAYRINNGYLKESVMDESGKVTQANKLIVKKWLRDQDYSELLESDYITAQETRNYIKGLLFKLLSDKASPYEKSALTIASKEVFTGSDLLEFSIVSSLPSYVTRSEFLQDIKNQIWDSEPLTGNVGDTIIGDIIVVDCFYSQAYNKFRIQARMGESFIDFWYKSAMTPNHEYHIKGKIKQHRTDKSTQLNFVKLSK